MKNYELSLTLNGKLVTRTIDPADTLLDFLRETVWLTGSKEGCGKGECGACTVFLDGVTCNSCLVMAVQANGGIVTTIEGLPKKYQPLQEAMLETGGAQCGICTPGFIMSAAALLEKNPDPNDAEIRTALEGNLCRCTGYIKIFDAVKCAAERIK